jgi:hypothetical protein
VICIRAIVIACRAVVALKTLGQESEFEHALGTRVRCLLGLYMVGRAFWGGGQSGRRWRGLSLDLAVFDLTPPCPQDQALSKHWKIANYSFNSQGIKMNLSGQVSSRSLVAIALPGCYWLYLTHLGSIWQTSHLE